MGNLKQSQLRRAENEVIFKQRNEKIGRQIAKILPSENKAAFLVEFMCECSNENCHEPIELPVDDFQALHANDKRFILKPGHNQGDVEHVIKRYPNFSVVEKYEVPPTTDGVLNRT